MFIQINANPDGSHAFQIGGNLEDGWAVVPNGMTLPDSFPYVDIETAMVKHPAVKQTKENGDVVVIVPEYTQLEVVLMTAGEEIPAEATEDGPAPVSGPADTVYDDLAAAYKEGVQSA